MIRTQLYSQDPYLVTVFSFLLSKWLKPGERFSFGDRFGLYVTETGANIISLLAAKDKVSLTTKTSPNAVSPSHDQMLASQKNAFQSCLHVSLN